MKKGQQEKLRNHYKQAANDILERRLRVYKEDEGLDELEKLFNG